MKIQIFARQYRKYTHMITSAIGGAFIMYCILIFNSENPQDSPIQLEAQSGQHDIQSIDDDPWYADDQENSQFQYNTNDDPDDASEMLGHLLKHAKVKLYYDSHNYGQCKRVKHVSYIKTYKTGSSTMSNILNRVALNYNSSVLIFLKHCKVPTPVGQTRCPLPIVVPFRYMTQPNFGMTMDHLEYDADYLKPMLPSDTIFISTLRDPIKRLRASLYFRGLYTALDETDIDPIEKFLSMPEIYKDWWSFNQMHHYFKIPRKDVYLNTPEIYPQIFKNLSQEFPLMVMLERFEESLVYIRRRLCWETKDFVYLKLKSSSSRKYKDYYRQDIIDKHRQYNPVDYALYQYFNRTYELKFQNEPPDFWDEVAYFKDVNSKVGTFCAKVHKSLKEDPTNIVSMYKDDKMTLYFPETRWGGDFTVNAVNCALMMINEDVFKNMHMTRQYPKLCKKRMSYRFDINHMGVGFWQQKGTYSVQLHHSFCSQYLVHGSVPLEVLTKENAYDWDIQVPRVGEWDKRVNMYSLGMLGAAKDPL